MSSPKSLYQSSVNIEALNVGTSSQIHEGARDPTAYSSKAQLYMAKYMYKGGQHRDMDEYFDFNKAPIP